MTKCGSAHKISQVAPGSIAEEFGIEPGDSLLLVNGQKVEDVLNIELARRIKAHNEAQLRSFLTGDLKELNVCFKNGAYKATLMLAGSILEAVLIDWLSEIHHKDLSGA